MDTKIKIKFPKTEVEFKGIATLKEDENEKVFTFQSIDGETPIQNKHLRAWSVIVNDNETFNDSIIYLAEDKIKKGIYQFTIQKKEPENNFERQPQGKSTVVTQVHQ